MNKIRIGLIGTGFISDYHFHAFNKINETEIVGITRDFYGDVKERNRQRDDLDKKAKEFNIRIYKDYEEIVNEPEINALIITSINPLHYPQIMNAISNGKHLLVEKPVVTDFIHLNEIEKSSKEKGIIVFPAHNFVYRYAVRKAREIIDSGALGKIIHASFIVTHQISEYHATGWRAKKELSAGGALMDSGHHLVYQSIYLMGFPEKLQAFTSNICHKNMECEDTACINLYYKNGTLGTIMQSWAPGKEDGINGLRIFGDKGNIVISDALYHNSIKINEDVGYDNSFYNLALAFTNCLINKEKPISDLNDVRNTLKIILGAYESADKEIVIRL